MARSIAEATRAATAMEGVAEHMEISAKSSTESVAALKEQIAESVRQATLDRTMHVISNIEVRYRAFDSEAWRKLINEFDFLLPIKKISKNRVDKFITHAQSFKEFKDLVELLNLAGEAFHGVEIGLYNQKYVFERGFQFFFDLWRHSWPLIAMEREKEKIIFPGDTPTYMIDLENYLLSRDKIFVPLPRCTDDTVGV